MKYAFTLQTTSNNEFTLPQLIKDGIGGCVHDSFLPTLIYIESWSSGTNKMCSVEIGVTCGDSIESGESITTIMSLWKDSVSTGKITFANQGKEHSIWIKAKNMTGDIVSMTGYVEIHDPNNMPVAGFEIADNSDKK